MPDAIHIHEDDWGMRSLYPLGASPEIERDLHESRAASERNMHPSGFGWTAMHMIQEPSVDCDASSLRVVDVAERLSDVMPRVKSFAATIGAHIGSIEKDPYGSYDNEAWCFGFGADCFIKLEPDGEFVKGIWYDFASGEAHYEQAMRRAFQVIEEFVPSLLVDYHQHTQGALGDPVFLDRYFDGIREWRIAVDKAVEEHQRASEVRAPWWKRWFG